MPRKKKSAISDLSSIVDSVQTTETTSEVADTIDRIRAYHRQRCFAMEQRKRVDQSLLAFLRGSLGWSLKLPETERKRIAAEARALAEDEGHEEWGLIVAASHAARKPFEDIERRATIEATKLAEMLPVWAEFGLLVRGFGLRSLATIVGEAGDIGSYSTVAKLWKRMGLAVLDGARQGGLTKTASKELWIAHGYNRQRRSRMWTIGDVLIKSNRDGEYRTTYLRQKEKYLREREGIRPIHAHRMAQRYMEKRLLKHLWQAWRRSSNKLSKQTSLVVPAAENHMMEGAF